MGTPYCQVLHLKMEKTNVVSQVPGERGWFRLPVAVNRHFWWTQPSGRVASILGEKKSQYPERDRTPRVRLDRRLWPAGRVLGQH